MLIFFDHVRCFSSNPGGGSNTVDFIISVFVVIINIVIIEPLVFLHALLPHKPWNKARDIYLFQLLEERVIPCESIVVILPYTFPSCLCRGHKSLTYSSFWIGTE